MSEWKETNLGDICTDISYGYTASAVSEKVGPKFLRITDIVTSRIDWNSVPYCYADDATMQKYKLENGDIVIARTGATTGYNKIMKNINCNAIFASYLIRYKIDIKLAYPQFIGHILQSKYWYEFIDAIAGGSAQPVLMLKNLQATIYFSPHSPNKRQLLVCLAALMTK
jgi:type I restriction enzyme S subunit